MSIAEIIAISSAAYGLAGVVFAIVFVTRGIGRIDVNAHGAPWSFRFLILPGTAALWPWLAILWARAAMRSAA